MKRLLICLCCLTLVFAAYAAENSAVIGANVATKGAAAVTNAPVKMDEYDILVNEIIQLKAAGVPFDVLLPRMNRLDELEALRGSHGDRNSLDACNTCATPNTTIDPVPTTVYAGSVSGNCGTEGKWYANFTAIAGYVYHFDLCPNTPGAGTGNFDADIAILSSACAIITGQDGSCSGGPNSYLPNDFTWTCPTSGTYYVRIAPYRSYNQNNCTGTASNTFTMQYYTVAPTLPDLAISNLAPCGGVNAGNYTVSMRVTNIGVATSLAAVAHYNINAGAAVENVNVPAIAPSSFFDVYFTVPLTVAPLTSYTLKGYVDAVTGNGPTANDAQTCLVYNSAPDDDCGGATLITPGYSTLVDITNGYNNELPNVPTTCIRDDGGSAIGTTYHGRWFKVVGNDNYMTASTCGSDGTNGDTKLSVFTGDCNNLVCVGADDDGCDPASPGDPSGFRSRFTWCTDRGTTYYILVGAYSSSTFGTFPFALTQGDNCHINCATMFACGTPAEVEPNDACPPSDAQDRIMCDGTVYGTICPLADIDWWMAKVPAMSKYTLTVYQGANCDVTPATLIDAQFYSDCSTTLGSIFQGSYSLVNSGASDAVVYLKVYSAGGAAPYKLVATCCPLANPCDNITAIGPVYHFNATVNTCPTDPCGTAQVVPCVYATDCATGSCYGSGPQKVFSFQIWNPVNTLVINVTGGDTQFMVFTNCADPYGTCVMSRDASGTETGTLTNLPVGTYYILVGLYSTIGGCGDVTLDIASDVVLPVALSGDVVATPSDGAVTLTWATASETHNDHFAIVRNGQIVGTVHGAGQSATRHDYRYADNGLTNGTTYSYTLRTVSAEGVSADVATVAATPSINATMVNDYALLQNYPNPFNPATDIVYDVKAAGKVTLKVYNMVGQEVATLVNGNVAQGRHTVSFSGTNLPSGLYLCKMTAGDFTAQIKMLLMK